jgi:hypothetical protein
MGVFALGVYMFLRPLSIATLGAVLGTRQLKEATRTEAEPIYPLWRRGTGDIRPMARWRPASG